MSLVASGGREAANNEFRSRCGLTYGLVHRVLNSGSSPVNQNS